MMSLIFVKHMAFFIPLIFVTLYQFYSIISSVLFTKFHYEHGSMLRNYRIREKKIFCIYGYFSVSVYFKGGKKLHL